jgi:5-methylcytosine-specific restriction endonuclease McrA
MKKDWNEYTKEDIDKYRKQFVIATLRRASYRWPWRNMAAKAARRGYGIYACAACGSQTVRNKDKKIDHINPVVSTTRGFVGFNTFARRLLVPMSGFQVLCTACHTIKTRGENERRKAYRSKA